MNPTEPPRDGQMHRLEVDPRDHGPDHPMARYGNIRGCATLHVPGVTDRAAVTASVHKVIMQTPHLDGEPDLCGVEHAEDVGIWQTPYTGRSALRRQIAQLGAKHHRPVVIVQGYQHVGPCPTDQTPKDPTS